MKLYHILLFAIFLIVLSSCGGENNNQQNQQDPLMPEDQTTPMDDTMGLDSIDSLEGPLRP